MSNVQGGSINLPIENGIPSFSSETVLNEFLKAQATHQERWTPEQCKKFKQVNEDWSLQQSIIGIVYEQIRSSKNIYRYLCMKPDMQTALQSGSTPDIQKVWSGLEKKYLTPAKMREKLLPHIETDTRDVSEA